MCNVCESPNSHSISYHAYTKGTVVVLVIAVICGVFYVRSRLRFKPFNVWTLLLVTGADARGAPIGVAPDMAAELARRLGVPVQLEPFAHPDVLCEAATAKRWDIALVGADPARAEHIEKNHKDYKERIEYGHADEAAATLPRRSSRRATVPSCSAKRQPMRQP